MEWVSSNELMIALGAAELDPNWDSPNARAVLRRAQDGILRARADTFIKNGENLGESDLSKDFWWAGDDSYQLRRNWVSGDFVTNDPVAGDEWRPWKAYGVQWRKEDAEAMGADFSLRRARLVDAKSAAGRKPDEERWKSFYFSVITIAKEGRLTKSSFKTREDLSEEILSLMGRGAFNGDYVKPIVSQIFSKFIGV